MKKLKRTLALTLVLCMLCSLLPVSVLAAETAPTNNLRPTDSPFQAGTGDSNSFRIPALVTLSDGTLVAAADARWNTTYDGGGLDTMIAISEDDGATWTHSFANYLGDNGNEYNYNSTCFIDPSLAVTSDNTIYMLCDLYPYGIALNGNGSQTAPSNDTGFNNNGYLALTNQQGDSGYYLKDGKVYSSSGYAQNYTVDAYFNLYDDSGNYVSNLFFSDSPYKVQRTGFLYLTKSTDGGESWSAPELLNLKTSSEMVCLVGPNGGMVTKNGVIVFPVYSYNGENSEQTGLIYSDDEGATWKRSPNFTGSTSKSSEADVVELDNGKLRVFYRNTSANLCYADYDLSTNTWGNQVNTGVFTNSNTELSAITYSKSVIHNGVEKTVILVSCPASANLAGSKESDGSWRTSGRIFAGLIAPATCEMTWLDNSVPVTPVATSQLSGSTFTAEQGFFAYSSMTETLDGDVAILYENSQNGWGAGDDYSYTMDFKTYSTSDLEQALGVTFVDSVDVDGSGDDSSDELEITMSVGDVKTDIIEDVFVDGDSTSTDEVDVHWVGTKTNGETTEVTFTAKAVGETEVTIGPRTYNITVTVPHEITKTVDVAIPVNGKYTYTHHEGDLTIHTEPNKNVATMTVGKQLTPVTSIESGKQYLIVNKATGDILTDTAVNVSGKWGGKPGLETTGTASTDSTELWTITGADGKFTVVQGSNYLSIAGFEAYAGTTHQPILTLNYVEGSGWTIYDDTTWKSLSGHDEANYYLSDNVGNNYTGGALGTSDTSNAYIYWDIYEITPVVEFTGVAIGTTTAIVGTTQYNITVMPDSISNVVKIELEVGESYTYTDTTGNHSANIIQQPNGTYASMTVTGSANSIQKKLVPVTAATFTANKRYVIENVRAKGNQADHSVLTSEEITYVQTGLIMNGPLNPESSPTWIITPDDNHYLISRNNEYLTFSDYYAATSTSSTQIDLNYVEGQGWTITCNGFYLSDRGSTHSGEAFGSTNTEDGIYWNIYELVTEQLIDATKVVFTGEAVGTTTAIVGSTEYIITVVPVEVDDEVLNTATNIWTVDPEIQRERYNSLIGLHKDLFTDASWKVYETARQAAYKKLVEVTNAQYSSAEDAEAALAELTKLIDQLVTAKAQLESAKTISVRYTLNGQELDIREYKIGANDKTATLPDTIVVNNIAYKVTITELDLTGETGSGDTAFEVPVTVIGKLGGGFVGSQDINAGNHNGHQQICDLVDNSNAGKKITEMTLTTGISYDLNLATDTTGMTVTWTTDNSSVATVDQNGNVTAVGTGTTNITATITDANGNVVEVNTIPVTVFPKGTADRKTAIYIEGIDNTTVWCVVNGDTTNYGFEVIEGELIYGQFDTTVKDGTKTTAMSFFGDPDEAHALVYMKSTNSDDHYFLLHDDDGNTYDGSQSGKASDKYYVSGVTSCAGWWQAVGLNDNQTLNTADRWKVIYDMVDWAVDLGCDGGLGFTRRQSEGALASNLTFASDPMPRIEKVVDGVLPTSRKQADYERYTPNMVAAVNELVYFKITITQEVPSVWGDAKQTIGAITYQNAWVTDTILPGAYLYNKELDQEDGIWDGEVAEGSRTQEDELTGKLNAAWTDEQKAAGKRIFEYYLVYEIQESDIPKFYIDNIANLSYNYGSKYSKGAQAGTADAEARITVVGSAIDNVVIDFGQSFVYQSHDFTSITDGKSYTFTGLRNVHLKGAYVNGENDIAGITECHAEANYGEVEVTRKQLKDENGHLMFDSKGYPEYEYIVTYTPTTILQGADAVRIYGMGENNQEKVINGFLVYPATTVYYEEGFMLDNNSSWDAVNGWSSNPGWDTTNAKAATVNQSFELLGMSQFDNHGMLTGKISNLKHNYGFDPIYDGSTANGEAAKSWITADKVGDSTSFTFTGTGFELFADCTENSGYVNVTVVNAEGQTVKVFMVNTVVKGGHSSATDGQTGDMDSLPIVSLKDLPHGTYTVTLGKVMNDSRVVTIDGVRITNTLADSSVYTIDAEDNPEFYQLRDMVLHSLVITPQTSEDYGDLTGKAQQVYNDLYYSKAETEEPFAIITYTGENYKDSNDTQDLLDNGPKNEVYLWADQTLTFNVTTSRLLQVGLKAPRGATSYTIKVDNNVVKSADLKTTVDLFYELGNTNGTEHTYTISITNTGSDILAITDLKICDDPNAKFEHITYDTIVDILVVAGYSDGEEPEVPDEPEIPDVPMNFVDVPEGSYYYPPVVWAVKNGITNGISQSHFGSEMDCNRAQVVTFLWRAAGCPEPTITENPFVDVEAGSFYEKAVLWAVENNITNGTDKTHFSPNLTCNRASVVTFLYRAFEEPVVEDVENPFTDVPAETWFTQPVLWAVEQEITNGIGGGLFGVDDMCNRAQIVTFLHRAYN